MSDFQIMYLCFGGFVVTAGLVMVVTYSLTNPWWTSHLGRMMIVYAVAEIAMSTLLLAAVVWQFSPHWFRLAWFFLQAVVGSTFWYQTAVIVRLSRERRARGRSPR